MIGDLDEGEYTRERDRLQALRDDYSRKMAQTAPVVLDGVCARWEQGNPAERRALLMEFFDRLHAKGGRIVGMTPRADRWQRVTLLVEFALGPDMAGTAGNIEGGKTETSSILISSGSGEGGI